MVKIPEVSAKERSGINQELRKLSLEGRFSDANTQLHRVMVATAGADWYTLRGIEKLLSTMFPGEGDTQAAISARLREVSAVRHGLVKQVRIVRNDETGKKVWFYRLVPSKEEVTL
ncbi:hypothetical protein PMPD1_2488 [Paramixta manurensis]|uniref:Uncharacterized protein n=1 Tax=Paramixta manurensis TaxID=2740817 RepID=A0A6M8UI61_9GAMM|nr:hypothetical protein PMPD1_2488 [Erwiniaceae bacterium PD-1]